MRVIYAILLSCLHFVYSLITDIRTWRRSRSHTHAADFSRADSSRRRIPKHLAILFVIPNGQDLGNVKTCLLESIVNAAEWCRTVGVTKLTLYEENDLLSEYSEDIRKTLPNISQDADTSESETEYPLTPPPSDYSESRPLSPSQNHSALIPLTTILISDKMPSKNDRNCVKRRDSHQLRTSERKDLQICLVSRSASKPAIAAASQSIAEQRVRVRGPKKEKQSPLSVVEFDHILEDEEGLSCPDFMLLHDIQPLAKPSASSELHGFPPWHIHLTEIYHNHPLTSLPSTHGLTSLDQAALSEAIDEYSRAEFRLGK